LLYKKLLIKNMNSDIFCTRLHMSDVYKKINNMLLLLCVFSHLNAAFLLQEEKTLSGRSNEKTDVCMQMSIHTHAHVLARA